MAVKQAGLLGQQSDTDRMVEAQIGQAKWRHSIRQRRRSQTAKCQRWLLIHERNCTASRRVYRAQRRIVRVPEALQHFWKSWWATEERCSEPNHTIPCCFKHTLGFRYFPPQIGVGQCCQCPMGHSMRAYFMTTSRRENIANVRRQAAYDEERCRGVVLVQQLEEIREDFQDAA
jgi:hypothetical protein